MSGVGFLDSMEKSVTISDPDNRPHEVYYFTFHSSLYPNAVDPQASNSVHQFEFSLRLLHNSTSSFVNFRCRLLPTFNETFSSLSDALLNQVSEIETRDILSAQRDSLYLLLNSKN